MVNLRIPPDPAAVERDEMHQVTRLIERKVAAIIEAEKPAHTGYELNVEIDPNLEWQN